MAYDEWDYGKLVVAGHGLDDDWMVRGRCFNWGRRPARPDDPIARPGVSGPPKPTPWQVSHDDVVDGIRGSELQNYARIICAGCPQQYHCARYAVHGLMLQGTWAMRISLLKKLQKMEERNPGSGIAVINAAEAEHLPVQFADKLVAAT